MRVAADVGTRRYGEKYILENYVLEIRPFYKAKRDEYGKYIKNTKGEFLHDVVGITLKILSIEKSELSGVRFTLPINVVNTLYNLSNKYQNEIQVKPDIKLKPIYMKVDEKKDKYSKLSAAKFNRVSNLYRRKSVR